MAHKMTHPRHTWMTQSIVELDELVSSNGRTLSHTRQCVCWNVILSRTVYHIEVKACEFQSPALDFIILDFSSVSLAEHERDRLLVGDQREVVT